MNWGYAPHPDPLPQEREYCSPLPVGGAGGGLQEATLTKMQTKMKGFLEELGL
jgi:hypothetical protein